MTPHVRYMFAMLVLFAVTAVIVNPIRAARVVGHAVSVFRDEVAPRPLPQPCECSPVVQP